MTWTDKFTKNKPKYLLKLNIVMESQYDLSSQKCVQSTYRYIYSGNCNWRAIISTLDLGVWTWATQ